MSRLSIGIAAVSVMAMNKLLRTTTIVFRVLTSIAFIAIFAAAIRNAPAQESTEASVEFFEKRIRPILVDKCFECHSERAKIVQSGLKLDSRAGLTKGGDGGLVFIPDEPMRSRLLESIRYTNADLQMPPEGKLSASQMADVEEWLRMGAPYPRELRGSTPAAVEFNARPTLWSVQPIIEPSLPDVRDNDRSQSPIDRFILAKLEAAGMRPSPPADRRTLLRRATFDLTGLPPTPSETDDFLHDESPRALERVVDRLLESPHYGQRWGRHWLDVVRYADTAGCNSDYPIPEAHKYRDYVIQSFNDDLPYDRFLREQIAGDLLPYSQESERRRQIIATGYLAISRRYGSSDPEFHLTIEDTIDNVGKALLGLSISCARCHDHKFDPISTRDYYGLYGIFESTRYAFPGMEDFPHRRDFVALADSDRAAVFDYQSAVSDLDHRVFDLKQELKALKRTAATAPPPESESPSGVAPQRTIDARPRTIDSVQKEFDAATKQLNKLLKTPPAVDVAYAVWEGRPADARLQLKGDPQRLADEVPRAFPAVLGGYMLHDPGSGSGRLELAGWLTDQNNPLTARVLVNRIWQHHFGRGLVATPNDFGLRGSPPTHPELLDWLAARFMADGWSIKSLHRLLMLSDAYQRMSVDDQETARLDPENLLLGRFSRLRLDAEELRDAMLSVSGNLDPTMEGGHPFPTPGKIRYTQHKPFGAVYESNRRSVYLMRQRRQAHPYLDLFDAADPKTTTPLRSVSTTALQALFMMNGEFVHEQAAALSEQLLQSSDDEDVRIKVAYRIVFVREPTEREVIETRRYLARCGQILSASATAPQNLPEAAWASFCRVLLASNEFVFID